ncbi:MAG: putative primosomal protein n [Actinomycetota bacterium]
MTSVAPDVVRVLCDAKGPDKAFDYGVPPELAERARVGSIVRVDLHGRRLRGWIVDVDPPERTNVDRLLPLRAVSGMGPDAHLVELAAWAAHRWAGRSSHFLAVASPPRVILRLGDARRSGLRPEPRSPATTELLAAGGGTLRLPPGTDQLPVVWSAVALGTTLVVVPGLEQVAILASRLRRAGVSVAVLPDEWAAAAAGVDVVIGTRTAAFARVDALAAVVVLDEHDERLQSEASPTWHAREVALERGARLGVPVVLVSPVPSVEAMHERSFRAPGVERERRGWPRVEVVDLDTEDPRRRGLVSGRLIEELRDHSRRVVCVVNTVGRSRLLACSACRSLARCELCDGICGSEVDGGLTCRRCGTDRPAVCAACGASAFRNLRPGVSRLREEMEAAAGRPVIDIESARHDVGATIDADAVVGTEAALHRVGHADTVVICDLDDELLAARYTAPARTAALVALAARRVGRAEAGGLLILQTRMPDHRAVTALASLDLDGWSAIESSQRGVLGLPPFGSLAVVEGPGADDFITSLGHPDVVIGGGDGRWQVRARDAATLSAALASGVRVPGRRLRIAVDPVR